MTPSGRPLGEGGRRAAHHQTSRSSRAVGPHSTLPPWEQLCNWWRGQAIHTHTHSDPSQDCPERANYCQSPALSLRCGQSSSWSMAEAKEYSNSIFITIYRHNANHPPKKTFAILNSENNCNLTVSFKQKSLG